MKVKLAIGCYVAAAVLALVLLRDWAMLRSCRQILICAPNGHGGCRPGPCDVQRAHRHAVFWWVTAGIVVLPFLVGVAASVMHRRGGSGAGCVDAQ